MQISIGFIARTACAALLFLTCTCVYSQTIAAQLLFDAVVPAENRRKGSTVEMPAGYSVGLGLSMNLHDRSMGLRAEREYFNYSRTYVDPPFQVGFREQVAYQVNRIALYAGVSVGRHVAYRWKVLGGFGVSWVHVQGVTGVREYTDGTVQVIELGADATQRAYSIMVGLNCTRMFSNRIGMRAEFLPLVRLTQEWVDVPRGNGFTYPVVPDPLFLFKAGVSFLFQFGASDVEKVPANQ